MNLKSIEYFLITVEEMNFTRAAGRLYISQQALSSHISRLEEEYGIRLFERRPALSLTPVNSEDGNREFDIPQESCEEALADRLSLKSTLHTLAPEDRRLIYLRFFKNKTQSETARILGTTQVQISRRERKIIQAMRRQMLQ